MDEKIKKGIEALSKTLTKELSQELINLLLEQNFTGKQLAEDLAKIAKSKGRKITPNTISNIKRGTNKVGPDLRKAIIIAIIILCEQEGIYSDSSVKKVVELYLNKGKASPIEIKSWKPIDQMLNQKHWFYFYEYKNSTPKHTILMRQVLSIRKTGSGQYEATIDNNLPYPTYKGEVEYVTDTMVGITLKGGGKRQIVYFGIPEENLDKQPDFYVGVYLKHNRDGEIFSGNVIIQPITSNSIPQVPLDIQYGVEDEIKEVDGAVRDFFRQGDKNLLNPPRHFRKVSFEKALKEQNIKMEYDLFVAYPYMTLDRKEKKGKNLKSLILQKLREFKLENGKPLKDSPNYDKLEENLNSILEESILKAQGIKPPHVFKSKTNIFKSKVQELITKLKMIDGIDNIKLRVFDSRDEINPLKQHYKSPARTVKRDWEIMKRSKALLLICPYEEMFSSCWVELGWAMAWQKPIFIVCVNNRENLPFILHDRSTLFNIYYYYNLSSVEDVPNVSDWIKDEYRNKLF